MLLFCLINRRCDQKSRYLSTACVTGKGEITRGCSWGSEHRLRRPISRKVIPIGSSGLIGPPFICLVGFDERANLAAIGIPILCLAGEHDPLAPPSGIERMAGKIPYARYVCLSGVGHFANLEAPAAFDAVLFAFLAQVPELRSIDQWH